MYSSHTTARAIGKWLDVTLRQIDGWRCIIWPPLNFKITIFLCCVLTSKQRNGAGRQQTTFLLNKKICSEDLNKKGFFHTKNFKKNNFLLEKSINDFFARNLSFMKNLIVFCKRYVVIVVVKNDRKCNCSNLGMPPCTPYEFCHKKIF